MKNWNFFYKILLLAVLALIFANLTLSIIPGDVGVAIRQTSAHWALIFIIVFVMLVEIRVRIKGGSKLDNLLKMHIIVASGFFVTLLLLNFVFNGAQHPYHAWLSYVSFILFLGTAGTGVPMILERF